MISKLKINKAMFDANRVIPDDLGDFSDLFLLASLNCKYFVKQAHISRCCLLLTCIIKQIMNVFMYVCRYTLLACWGCKSIFVAI